MDQATSLEGVGELLRAAFGQGADEQLPSAFAELLDRLDASSPAALPSGLTDAEFKAKLLDVIPRLRTQARSLTRDRTAADDLVQDALVRAWTKRASFREGTNFNGWTYTILRNLFFTQSRRTRFRAQWDEHTAERLLAASAGQEHHIHLADLQRALGQLPAAQREVLMLVGAGQMAYEEAAEVCGVKIGTIKSRAARARAALVRLIDGDESPDADPASAAE